MQDPQVSVVMPVRNAERYVAEAVKSILTQSFGDFEFLIFNDGSTDDTIRTVHLLADQDRRIQVFSGPHRGYVPWLNEGVRLARGEFVARMDADDVSLPQRFARQVEFLLGHAECVAVGSFQTMIDPEGLPLGTVVYDTEPEVIEANLLNGKLNVICHPASMMRRSALVTIGGYREEHESVEDFALWLDLAEQGSLANIPSVLFKYRQHHSSVSATRFEVQKRQAELILQKARQRRGLTPLVGGKAIEYDPPSSAGERHLEWAMVAASSGYRRTALKHARIGLELSPRSLRGWAVLVRSLAPNGIVKLLKSIGLSRAWRSWHRRQLSG